MMKWIRRFIDWWTEIDRDPPLIDGLTYQQVRLEAEGVFGEEIAVMMTDAELVEWYNYCDRLEVLGIKSKLD